MKLKVKTETEIDSKDVMSSSRSDAHIHGMASYCGALNFGAIA